MTILSSLAKAAIEYDAPLMITGFAFKEYFWDKESNFRRGLIGFQIKFNHRCFKNWAGFKYNIPGSKRMFYYNGCNYLFDVTNTI